MYDLSHYLVPQPELLLNSLKLQLEALRNTRLEHFGVIYPLTLDAILNQRTNIEPKAYNRCLVSELRTVLTPLGAYICPYYRGISGKCYGDPNRMPFTELWMSPKREEIINATVPSSECLFHCIRKDSNLELVGVGKGKRLFEIGDDYDLFI